ncbi:GNAT family N-acetyltransferase [Lentzea sp. NPDC042327]|uniref:GNAT family N-acetyltransferase n=1 Tax=Lentzea sp. NPDC042327 TaxID=3154801 RepID=UPI0033E02C22
MMRGVLTEDLVLRPGTAADTDAVAALHGRCSMGTLFNRYHSGMSTVPRRWLHRLLSPSRGTTTVVQNGDRLIALGQLIRTGLPGCAEVSLLVEDAWQRRGVGAALLSALASEAELFGCRELVAWCLPSSTALVRTAVSAGLPVATRREDGLVRVSIAPRGSTPDPPKVAAIGEKTR